MDLGDPRFWMLEGEREPPTRWSALYEVRTAEHRAYFGNLNHGERA